jgi:sugar lactone lactonase YvrE
METVEARVLHRPTPASGYLPEGPRALGPGRQSWITIQSGAKATHGALHVLTSARGENRTWKLPGRPGFAYATNREGLFLIGMERSVVLYDTMASRSTDVVTRLDGHTTGTIVNDAALCSAGLVFGCKDTEFREHKAGLWFLRRRDLRVFELRRDQLCSNGKVLREMRDGRFELFNIDSPTRVVTRHELDPETGQLSEPTVAIDLHDQPGVPDGMVVVPGSDEVVIAMFHPEPAPYGRALQCSLRTGKVTREFRTPGAAQVTCPAWLQTQHGAQLVLTTATENLSREQLAGQPNAGCLFVAPAPLVIVPEGVFWAV